MGKTSDLKNVEPATTVASIANECVIKAWSSDARTSGVIREQGIRKDVPSAGQVAEETSLLAGCYSHQVCKELGILGVQKGVLSLSSTNTEPHKQGEIF